MEPRAERREGHPERHFHARGYVLPAVLTSLSMIDFSRLEPNLESGANIDCCKLYRDNRAEYERIVRESIREQLGL